MHQDIITHVPETHVDIAVAVTDDQNAKHIQSGVPLAVCSLRIFFIVLGSVNFYNKFCRGDIKVYNILIDDFLAFALMPIGLKN